MSGWRSREGVTALLGGRNEAARGSESNLSSAGSRRTTESVFFLLRVCPISAGPWGSFPGWEAIEPPKASGWFFEGTFRDL